MKFSFVRTFLCVASLACFGASFYLIREAFFWYPDYNEYSDDLRESYAQKISAEKEVDIAIARAMTNLYVNDLKANQQWEYARPRILISYLLLFPSFAFFALSTGVMKQIQK